MGRASHNLSSGQCVPPFLPIEDQQLYYHCHRTSYLCPALLNQWLLGQENLYSKVQMGQFCYAWWNNATLHTT